MANSKFVAAVKKAKALYKTGRYKKFSDAVAAAYKKGKKVGATKIIERGESKNTKPKKTYLRTRSRAGTFKGMKRIGNIPGRTTSLNNPKYYYIKSVKLGKGMVKSDRMVYDKALQHADAMKRLGYKCELWFKKSFSSGAKYLQTL